MLSKNVNEDFKMKLSKNVDQLTLLRTHSSFATFTVLCVVSFEAHICSRQSTEYLIVIQNVVYNVF